METTGGKYSWNGFSSASVIFVDLGFKCYVHLQPFLWSHHSMPTVPVGAQSNSPVHHQVGLSPSQPITQPPNERKNTWPKWMGSITKTATPARSKGKMSWWIVLHPGAAIVRGLSRDTRNCGTSCVWLKKHQMLDEYLADFVFVISMVFHLCTALRFHDIILCNILVQQ